jgi:hypothetical protein
MSAIMLKAVSGKPSPVSDRMWRNVEVMEFWIG